MLINRMVVPWWVSQNEEGKCHVLEIGGAHKNNQFIPLQLKYSFIQYIGLILIHIFDFSQATMKSI